ncbi:MAG: SusE domain-containing protein [Saprospiraceae bacterium]
MFVIAAMLFQSCKDEAVGPTVDLGNAPSITGPAAGTSFVLVEADQAKPFGDFTWTAADFGFDAGISYKVEVDLAGSSFADPITLGVVNGLKLSGKTVADINNILLNKGIAGGQEATVEVRVTATVSDEVDALVSAPVSLKITPYEAFVQAAQLQVPGSYQGWNPGDNTTIIFSPKSDKKYEGYIYFADSGVEFKYTDGPAWTKNWGDNGADGTLEPDGANLRAGDPGLYKLNVNLNELTHTYAKTDWGLIGSATAGGWDSDQDMTYNVSTGEVEITTDLVAGDIKFRANDDWAVNFGDDGGNKTLEYNGANIAVAEAGNYTIKLKLNAAKYTYTIQKN